MHIMRHSLKSALLLASLSAMAVPACAAEIDEIVIWGKAQDTRHGPASTLTPDDLASANVVTTEDLIKFEPGLIIRRRFVGDANGTLGMRGANMFQTSRSMVFGDGVPLHYYLQSRWDGAPRWSMISASEIDQVDILYGPFSAEYGGNAMGGVILMESRIPQGPEMHFDTTAFAQDFSAYGFDEVLTGYKTFLSAGDKFGDLSVYLSWNHLRNASQPQAYYMGAEAQPGSVQAVSGAIAGMDERGNAGFYFGDSGIIDSLHDNLKLKLGYELGDWSALLNVAFEDRSTDATAPNTYLRDAAGDPIRSGNVEQQGQALFVPASRFGISLGQRNSLSTGLRVNGRLGDLIEVESNLNWFTILRDENRVSARHPQDALYTPAGQVSDFGDTGWRTASLKFNIDVPAVDGLELVTGLHHEQYRLNIDVFESTDYLHASRDRYRARSGGETSLNAVFAQLDWDLGDRWELGLGLRAERWHSRKGYYSDDRTETSAFDLVQLPTRSEHSLSPKFSFAYLVNDALSLRYSAAKAWRFPIVEELFSQYQAFNSVNAANPDLAPERGIHHNLGFEYLLDRGELKLNLYQDDIRDVIEAQSMMLPGGVSVRTFLPITSVTTRGAEFVANLDDVLMENLDLRFNLAWTRARITRNLTDPSIVGNTFPRMPAWRANVLLNYHFNEDLDAGIGLRYASDSFGRLDNKDTAADVYGAQDSFLFVNLKANWQATPTLQFGIGVDNLFNEAAWVTHPWPARTLFLEARMQL